MTLKSFEELEFLLNDEERKAFWRCTALEPCIDA